METARTADLMLGDKLYQQRARAALPLLVRQAFARVPIFYSNLALELAMPNPRNLNYVLGSVGQTLNALSKQWGIEIPPIQCLVVNMDTGLPGEGIGLFIKDTANFRTLPKHRQRLLVNAELQRVFTFERWPEVLSHFGIHPVLPDFEKVTQAAASFRGGGESEQHRRLKEYVAANPRIVDLPSRCAGLLEYPIPSGDSVDVLFLNGDERIAVEVKSRLSPESDVVRGIFQCIKYRAVLEAHDVSLGHPPNARAVLVLEGALPSSLIPLKNMLAVEVIDDVTPTSAG